ncbi:phosphoribosyltransferase family protein [Nocardiopsis rhodophaea]
MNPLPVSLPFTDRSEAGRRLAERVRTLDLRNEPIVLALPRGGVPVAAELARRLRIPLDVLMVRKIGLPGHAELGVGAIAEDGQVAFDDVALARLHVSRDALMATVDQERAELDRRLRAYRGSRGAPRLADRDVIVVDDGVATGGTARSALRMVRRAHPARLVLAVPVGSQSAMEALRPEVDDLVVLTAPENFHAVGEWYRDFAQLTDADVTALLTELREAETGGEAERAVRIRAGDVYLDGDLATPANVRGAVVVALGHGRHDPRHRSVAARTRRSGLATLLIDLFTAEEWNRVNGGGEEVTAMTLGERLEEVVGWLRRATELGDARVGLFGSGAGAPAALVAAAGRPDDVAAVAAHGGRIDLAEERLPGVRAPTLVLVQGDDSFLRELAEWAMSRMGAPHELCVVPGAEQLLGEPGGWQEVRDAVAEWFDRHL